MDTTISFTDYFKINHIFAKYILPYSMKFHISPDSREKYIVLGYVFTNGNRLSRTRST